MIRNWSLIDLTQNFSIHHHHLIWEWTGFKAVWLGNTRGLDESDIAVDRLMSPNLFELKAHTPKTVFCLSWEIKDFAPLNLADQIMEKNLAIPWVLTERAHGQRRGFVLAIGALQSWLIIPDYLTQVTQLSAQTQTWAVQAVWSCEWLRMGKLHILAHSSSPCQLL